MEWVLVGTVGNYEQECGWEEWILKIKVNVYDTVQVIKEQVLEEHWFYCFW